MRSLLLGILFFASTVSHAAQAYIEKNGVRMPIEYSFAVLNKTEGKLNVYLLPTVISEAEKKRIINGEIFFATVSKNSPDKSKWSHYPYAMFELKSKNGKYSSKDDFQYFYFLMYGIEKQNFTDNLNGYFPEQGKLSSFSNNGNQIRLQFTGANKDFKIKWDVNVQAEIEATK